MSLTARTEKKPTRSLLVPVRHDRNHNVVAVWFQKKWASVFRKKSKLRDINNNNKYHPSVDFGIPLNEHGRQDTAESMTAEEFAKAVGIQILVATDADDEEEHNRETLLQDAAISTLPPSDPCPLIPLERRYMEANSVTLPLQLRTTSGTATLLRKNAPPPLDMSLFLPPITEKQTNPSPSRHTRSPSVPNLPSPSTSSHCRARSASVCVPALSAPSSQTILEARSASVSMPVSTSTHPSPRVVQVTNKGRFTLTRERSAHFTAPRKTHTRAHSASSRFQIVREEPDPTTTTITPLSPSKCPPIVEDEGLSREEVTELDSSLAKTGTIKSIDSGVSV